MQRTTNYNFKKPDYTDFADIQDINDNMDAIDEELAAPTGDLANAEIKSSTASTDSYPVPAANDTMKVMLGKIIKFCADIVKTFTGATSTRAGAKGLVPAPAANQHTRFLRADGTWREPVNGSGTTTAGDVLDARMGKTLNDKINTLNDSIQVKRAQYSYDYTIAANNKLSLTANDLGITVPSGYAILCLRSFSTGNDHVLPRTIMPQSTGETVCAILRNVSNSNQSGTFTFQTVWCKSSIITTL